MILILQGSVPSQALKSASQVCIPYIHTAFTSMILCTNVIMSKAAAQSKKYL